MTDLTSIIRSRAYVKNDVIDPLFFRLNKDSDRTALEKLLIESPKIEVFDEITGQLEELIKLRNPSKKFTENEIKSEILDHVGSSTLEDYGVWVYYPWNNTLVHILDEKEFVESRTNRNMYKITPKEMEILAGKKIGVIGLSVGQSVAVTLAMERSFGELRIADFDRLELTNMNRIRTCGRNLGELKTTIVAREIAEIDPYLKVKVFSEGITSDNIDRFLTHGGKLDFLVEECDDIFVKIQSRIKCKEYGIPVVMETSDGGVVDVERFDEDPNKPIFHGLLEGMEIDLDELKLLKTSEEKVPYVDAILNFKKRTTRLKTSVLEIENSLLTWPQLASEVTIGGGVVANLVRGDFTSTKAASSGRFEHGLHPSEYSNVKEWGSENTPNNDHNNLLPPQIEVGSGIPVEDVLQVISIAELATSAGNLQPWIWKEFNGQAVLYFDTKYGSSYSDPANAFANIGLGASIYNAEMAANELGYELRFELSNDKSEGAPVGWSNLTKATKTSEKSLDFDLVGKRFTDRDVYQHVPLSKDVKIAISESFGKNENMSFAILEGDMMEMADILSEAERLRFLHEKMHHELYSKELIFSQEEMEIRRRGLSTDDFNFTAPQVVGLEIARDPAVVKLLVDQDLGQGLKDISADLVKKTPAILLISAKSIKALDMMEVGSVFQDLWLRLTELNVAVHPVTSVNSMLLSWMTSKEISEDQFFGPRLEELNKRFENYAAKMVHDFPVLTIRLSPRLHEVEVPEKIRVQRPIAEYSNLSNQKSVSA